jgi:hypothetical protein
MLLAGLFLAAAVLIGLVLFGRYPAQQTGEVHILGADGRTYILTAWHARPLVPFWFLDNDTGYGYVQFGRDRFFVHGREESETLCPVWASPDREEVVIVLRHEKAFRAQERITLRTGERRGIWEWMADYERLGWVSVDWECKRR